SPGGAAVGADLGGSSKYSNENFEGRRGERFHVNALAHGLADPKGRGKPVRERVSARAPKGNRVKIPEPGRGGGRQR
ncbi:unnamed protein product, partial [Musa hybrid cultivar]